MYTPSVKQTFRLIFTFSFVFIFSASAILANIANVLPVKFIRFEAKQMGDMVYLRWLTDSEFNNDFFTVERSVDGENWTALDDIEPSLMTPGEGSYHYYDTNPIVGESLYRIKQTDYNGEFSYSFEEPINFSGLVEAAAELEVYPNPIQGDMFTVSAKFDLSNASVKLIDIAGKELMISVAINDTEMTVKPEKTIPGMYFLIIQAGPKSIVKNLKFE